MLLTLIVLELNTFQKKLKYLFIIKTYKNFFRIPAYNSVMCGYFYIGLIDFMLEGKRLTDFTNLFLPNNFKKNDEIILKKIQNFKNKTMLSYCLKCKKITECINPKILKTNNGKKMLLSKYAICGTKKQKEY